MTEERLERWANMYADGSMALYKSEEHANACAMSFRTRCVHLVEKRDTDEKAIEALHAEITECDTILGTCTGVRTSQRAQQQMDKLNAALESIEMQRAKTDEWRARAEKLQQDLDTALKQLVDARHRRDEWRLDAEHTAALNTELKARAEKAEAEATKDEERTKFERECARAFFGKPQWNGSQMFYLNRTEAINEALAFADHYFPAKKDGE